MLWHSLESQTSITSNTFRLQTSLIITACCFVISFHVCGSWLHLNDKAVTRTTLKALNGPLPYVLFYKAC